jgi:hypothetical protein
MGLVSHAIVSPSTALVTVLFVTVVPSMVVPSMIVRAMARSGGSIPTDVGAQALAGLAQVDDHLAQLAGFDLEVVVMVDLQTRGAVTGAQTLHFFQGEQAVWRGLARVDAQFLLTDLYQRVTTPEVTRDVGADLQVVTTVRALAEHRVEHRCGKHFSNRQPELCSDKLNDARLEPAKLLLRDPKHRNQGAFFDRITPHVVRNALLALGRESKAV